MLTSKVRGTLGGANSPVELRIPAFEKIESGYKLREIDPLHFDRHFGRAPRDDPFPAVDPEHPEFIGVWS